MKKFRDMKLRTKIGVGVASGATILAGAGGAFAYFTSSGSGTGSGAVGSAGSWTVTAGTVNGTIYPGQGSETISYTVTNAGNGNQELRSLSVAMSTKNNDITVGGTEVPGCQAAWFNPTLPGNALTPNVDMVPQGQSASTPLVASYQTAVTLTMTDSGTAQDACQGKAPDVVVTAG